jgi:hemerythrin-like domain-containing protein
MLHEHKEGRDFVRGMKAAAEKYSAGDGKAAAEFSRNARGYAALLRRHIDKEDNILYRMADGRFSENVQLSLEKEFERVEREVIGAGEHERFHGILHGLEELYPA